MADAAGCAVVSGVVDPATLTNDSGFDVVACFGDEAMLRQVRVALAERQGALLPLIIDPSEGERLRLERHVCIDTTAAGGNASLLAQIEMCVTARESDEESIHRHHHGQRPSTPREQAGHMNEPDPAHH